MNYASDAFHESETHECRRPTRKSHPRSVFGGVALAFVGLACIWSVVSNLFDNRVPPVVNLQPPSPTTAIAPTVSAERTTTPIDPDTYALLFDATYSSGAARADLSGGAPRKLDGLLAAPASAQAVIMTAQDQPPQPQQPRRVVHSVPMPASRPAELAPPQSRNASLQRRAQGNKVAVKAPDDKPSIFERLFGKPRPSGETLAYAAPDGGVSGDGQSITSSRAGLYDKWTAVYDISARTVYMPDGTKLEAHSGLGSRIDDPRYVHERMRGATPPHVYDLKLRESLFHGVRALRLIPASGVNPLGRTGLLAHTYMLGPNGDSNGCVSFKNYNAFLRAYLNQEIKRLVVVARLD